MSRFALPISLRAAPFVLAALLVVLFAWAPQSALWPWLWSPTSPSSARRAVVDAAAAAAELRSLAANVSADAGVCRIYPRCLLYSCCSAGLLATMQASFAARASVARDSRDTSLSAPLAARMQGHPLEGLTLTKDSLAQGLAALPPTSPSTLTALRTRREFRVLYLAQGDDHRATLPRWYLRNMKDLLYLSFRNVTADLFFPKSNLCEGRMALYLAGRLLEMQQGWLYDYFVFLDDDVAPTTPGPLASFLFELDLLQWEPAIAGPFFRNGLGPPTTSVGSTAHLDFLYIAYHREVLELIHPWVFDFDSGCTWGSQLLQTYEFDLVARNHVLFSRDFVVANSKHRAYPRECNFDGAGPANVGFPGVHGYVKQKAGKQRAHCLPKTGVIVNDGFVQYLRVGVPRPRLSSYALSPSSSFDDGCAGSPIDFTNPGCCSFEAFSPRVLGGPYHNRVVAERNRSFPDTYSFIWGTTRWEFSGADTLAALGFIKSDIIMIDAAQISAFAPLDMRSLHSQITGLPRASRISIAGFSSLQLVVSELGVAHLPLEHEAITAISDTVAATFSITLPIWRLQYLALSVQASSAVAEVRKALHVSAAQHQLLLMSANLSAPWPLQPWFKMDFVFVTCYCPNCCSQGFPGWDGRGPDLARGDMSDPFFAGIQPSLAARTLKLEDLVAFLHLPPASLFVVNIGAACGFGGYGDPTQRLFAGVTTDGGGLQVPVGGLLLDAHGDPAFFSAYPRRPNVTLVAPITMEPSSIAATLANYSVPRDFALLKVDVDSVELGLISSILAAGYHPAVLHLEINTIFPPPLRFSIPLNTSYAELASAGIDKIFGGVSLSAAADFLIPHGYRLVEVDGWDTIWIRSDLAKRLPSSLPTSLAAAFKSGFLERVERHPQCYCEEFLHRVLNREMWGVAEEAAAAIAANDAAGAAEMLEKARRIVDQLMPRHPIVNSTGGGIMRYMLSLTGLSDGKV